MARKVFYSFHYKPDNWRTAQVRNFGSLEGNPTLSDNDWEQVKAGGPKAIGMPSAKGSNPFSGVKIGELDLGTVVPVHDPPQARSTDVYRHIGDNLTLWAEQAVQSRGRY